MGWQLFGLTPSKPAGRGSSVPRTQAILDLSWKRPERRLRKKSGNNSLQLDAANCGIAGVCPAATSLSFLLCFSIP